jgi:hypothetical protein
MPSSARSRIWKRWSRRRVARPSSTACPPVARLPWKRGLWRCRHEAGVVRAAVHGRRRWRSSTGGFRDAAQRADGVRSPRRRGRALPVRRTGGSRRRHRPDAKRADLAGHRSGCEPRRRRSPTGFRMRSAAPWKARRTRSRRRHSRRCWWSYSPVRPATPAYGITTVVLNGSTKNGPNTVARSVPGPRLRLAVWWQVPLSTIW